MVKQCTIGCSSIVPSGLAKTTPYSPFSKNTEIKYDDFPYFCASNITLQSEIVLLAIIVPELSKDNTALRLELFLSKRNNVIVYDGSRLLSATLIRKMFLPDFRVRLEVAPSTYRLRAFQLLYFQLVPLLSSPNSLLRGTVLLSELTHTTPPIKSGSCIVCAYNDPKDIHKTNIADKQNILLICFINFIMYLPGFILLGTSVL